MINIGGVNVVEALIGLEQQVKTLENLILELNNKNASLPGFKSLTQDDYDICKKDAGRFVIDKYPQLGLKFDANE